MSKELDQFDLEERLIDFAVRIIRTKRIPHNSIFLVRYSIFVFH